MPMFNYTLSGSIEVPEGSKMTDTGTGIILPDGRIMKVWEQVELQDATGEDFENLSHDDCNAIGIHYDGDMARFVEA